MVFFINLQMDSGLSFQEKAEQTIKTNYFGVLHVTNTFAPLLQPNSRYVYMYVYVVMYVYVYMYMYLCVCVCVCVCVCKHYVFYSFC